MKKNTYIVLTLICAALLYSCQTVNQISFDYLSPADVSFPEQIRRVGVVNNVTEPPGSVVKLIPDSVLAPLKTSSQFYYLSGDAQIATNALAEAIANEHYFDLVVICDSALRANDTAQRETILHKEEAEQLAQDLEVDMLVALEQCWIMVSKKIQPFLGSNYISTVDAVVSPQVRLYLPGRNNPLATINSKDSIYWEGMYHTENAARAQSTTNEKIINEASQFTGLVPIKYLLPHWKTTMRFLFTNGSSEMRDAAFFVQHNEWERALPLWEKIFQHKSSKLKARAASNIALYYEQKDELAQATEWGNKSIAFAKKTDEETVINEHNLYKLTDYQRIQFNRLHIAQREADWGKLNTQMNRFK